jgi:hypothetical protein
MRSVEGDHLEAELSFGWEEGLPAQDDPGLERVAAYSVVLTRTLTAAGYAPRRLDVRLRRGASGDLEVHVRGDVPGIPEADFLSLARVTLHSFRLQHGLASDHEPQLAAHLEDGLPRVTELPSANGAHAAAATATPTRRRTLRDSLPLVRVAVGVAIGVLLGVVGLPRFELPGVTSPQPAPTPVATELTAAFIKDVPAAVAPTATAAPPPPTPTIVPNSPRLLFGERFATPVASWPNDPQGTAWFADNAYFLFAREPGRFVATGVPLSATVGNGVLAAQFHKVAGPAGGGYGLIIRHQGRAEQLDGRSQAGEYLVVEVGDRGDVGVWQRDQTRWIDIVPWSHSEAVRSGEGPNTLLVTLRNGELQFEVNGALVANVAYSGVQASGGVGVFVGGDLNEVALDWLRIETTDK